MRFYRSLHSLQNDSKRDTSATDRKFCRFSIFLKLTTLPRSGSLLKRRVLEGTRYYRQKANTLALSHPLRCPLLFFKQQHGTGILCPAILCHIFSVKFRFARFKITDIIALQQTRIHTVTRCFMTENVFRADCF